MDRKLFSKTLTSYAMAARFYHSNGTKMATLYSKISPLGDPNINLGPKLDDWVQDGKKVRVAELQRIVHDFRKRKRFSQALQVSEWMKKNGVCIFSTSEHAVQLDLIGRVRGYLTAETYFDQLKEEDKTEKTYGALLNCYVRQRQIDKSFSLLQKMKEMGLASSQLTYNDIMCLFTNVGLHEKVPQVLEEMKELEVSPDNFSYRICINSYGVGNDLEAMENILKEMESQPHIVMDWNTYAVVANFYIKAGLTDKAIDALRKSEERLNSKDRIGHNHLISLHATLGNKEAVLRLWNLDKSASKRFINRDYITMLESLVKLGDLEEADKVLKQWESSGNCYDYRVPKIVINKYVDEKLCERAEAVLEDLMKKGKATTPDSWLSVAAIYVDRKEIMKAAQCMKVALSLNIDKKWNPNFKMATDVATHVLKWLSVNASIEDVEAFLGSLKDVIPVNKAMFESVLDAHLSYLRKNEQDELKKVFGTRQKATQGDSN